MDNSLTDILGHQNVSKSFDFFVIHRFFEILLCLLGTVSRHGKVT